MDSHHPNSRKRKYSPEREEEKGHQQHNRAQRNGGMAPQHYGVDENNDNYPHGPPFKGQHDYNHPIAENERPYGGNSTVRPSRQHNVANKNDDDDAVADFHSHNEGNPAVGRQQQHSHHSNSRKRKYSPEREEEKGHQQHNRAQRNGGMVPPSANIEIMVSHYNARPNVSVQERACSPIYHLKNFNNWIKSVLIAEYCRPNSVVLDLCAGKGGDLPKWCKARISYWVAADIAAESVKAAQERYDKARHASFPALFICSDCCKTRLSNHLDKDVYFDLVSCQFALHYSFETEERAVRLLQNASDRLKPGGHFICTMPNSNWIVKKIRASETNSFGVPGIYEVKFPQTKKKKYFPTFGAQYTFSLVDAVDNVPEYLVHSGTLERLAAQVGLRIVGKWGFHQLYYDKCRVDQYRQLQWHMEAVDERGTLSPAEWEVAGFYEAFVFQKEDPHQSDDQASRRYGRLTNPKTGFVYL